MNLKNKTWFSLKFFDNEKNCNSKPKCFYALYM